MLKKIFVNTFFLSVARFVGMFFSFFVVLLLGRFFGPAGLGQYNFALSVAAFFVVLSDAGVSTVIFRELSRKHEKNFFSVAFRTKLVLFLFSVLFAACLSFLFSFSGLDYLFFFLILFGVIVDSFSLLFRSAFKAFQEMKLEAVVFIFQKFLFFLFSVLLFFAGFGLLGIAAGFALSNIFAFFLSLFLFFGFSGKQKIFGLNRGFLSFSGILLPFVFIGLLDIAASRADIFLISFFLKNDFVLGLYSAPKAIFDALLVVELSFFAALFPELSMAFHSGKEKLSQIVSHVIKYLAVFSLPIILVSFFFSKSILVLFFGPAFLQASVVFSIYSITLFFMLLQAFLFNVLFVADKQLVAAKIFFVTIVVNILFSFFLVPAFGIDGAAFSGLFSFFVCVLLCLAETKKLASIDYSFLPRVAAITVFSFLFFFLLSFASADAFFPFSLLLVPVFFFFALDKKDIAFLGKHLVFFYKK